MTRFFLAMGLLMSVGAAAGQAEARDCSYCNTLSNVGACCRGTEGCTYYKNHDTEQYVCKAAAAPKAAGTKVSLSTCNKNYNQCIRTVRGNAGRTKQAAAVTSDRKKNRNLAAIALRDGRARCKRQLTTCRELARGQ